MGATASKNCSAVAYRSSGQRLRPVHRPDTGACQDIRPSKRPCATTTSTQSVSPDSMFRRRLKPVEPPWYATRTPGGVGGHVVPKHEQRVRDQRTRRALPSPEPYEGWPAQIGRVRVPREPRGGGGGERDPGLGRLRLVRGGGRVGRVNGVAQDCVHLAGPGPQVGEIDRLALLVRAERIRGD